MKTSLIATTYNQPIDLNLFLQTAARQSVKDFEVVIADDGSNESTAKVIEAHRGFFGPRLKHVWHEDTGYRKTVILNQAVRSASGDLLVFTDSDLILHPRFIQDHMASAKPRGLFMGRRVDLSQSMSEWIRKNPEQMFSLSFYARIFCDGLRKEGTRNPNRLFRVASSTMGDLLGMSRVPDLLGSNFSIDRKLLEELNGFNESLQHYWGEDGDLFVRARNASALISGRKSFAVQLHLWHPFRKPLPNAESWYRDLLLNREYVRCEHGLIR